MKFLSNLYLVIPILHQLCGACLSAELQLELLPKGRPFRLTFADPREIKMAITYDANSRIQAMVGNYFSLFSLGPATNDWSLHFGLEGAGYFSLRQAEQRYPLESTDGLLGTYVEIGSDPWCFQVRYTHISAHVSDGSDGAPIAFSRETLHTKIGFTWNESIQLYGGGSAVVNSIPSTQPFGLQMGAVLFSNWGLGKLTPFTAADIKWRQETSYNPSVSLQLGIAVNNPPQVYRSFRFFYAYFTGTDPRGQFYLRSYTSHSIGVEMQI